MTAKNRLGELLREPVFQRVWLVGALAGVARWLEMLVVGVFAFEATGSPFLVALLIILRQAPLVLFGAIVGTFADRFAAVLLLRISLVVALLAALGVFLLFAFGLADYWHVAVATFVTGLVWTTDMPLRRRLLGDVAGPARIAPAMGLDSATNNATRMLGPLLGGLVYQWLGTSGAFALNALLYLLSLLLLLGVPTALSMAAKSERPNKLLRDFREAFQFAVRNRDVLRILLVTVVFNLWGFPFVSMIPVIGSEELGLDAGWIGGLAAMEGAGAFLGALAIAVGLQVTSFRRLYYFGTIGFLVFVFVAGWMTHALPFSVALFLVGLGGACFTTMQSTLIYSVAPPEMRGRLFGLLVLCIGTAILGFANIGLMGEWFGGSVAIRIVAAEGLIPLLLIGLGWRELWRPDEKGRDD